MWWREGDMNQTHCANKQHQVGTRRAILRLAVAVVIPLTVSACFRPLYGSSGAGGSPISAEFSAIQVDGLSGFLGHELRNELVFLLRGGNEPATPRYRLDITSSEVETKPITDQQLGRSEAGILSFTAAFSLFSLTEKKVLTSGRLITPIPYDRGNEPYATLRAQRDARQRGARLLAEQMRGQLAAYFADRAT
jgi:LPS-assembly lipoprotein